MDDEVASNFSYKVHEFLYSKTRYASQISAYSSNIYFTSILEHVLSFTHTCNGSAAIKICDFLQYIFSACSSIERGEKSTEYRRKRSL